MLTRICVFLLTLFLAVPCVYAKEIAGISFSDTHELSQGKLFLNGAGIRKKFFIKLYVGGLYLEQNETNSERIIEADVPMAIKLHIISSMITSEKMEKATMEGFLNSTGGNIDPLRPQIEKFISVFKEEIQINDIYDLLYLPGKGLEVYKNGNAHSLIEGLDFKQALFGIWLSDNPAQLSLKNEMLGK